MENQETPNEQETTHDYTNISWQESSKRRLYFRNIAIGFWMIFMIIWGVYEINTKIPLLEKSISENGFWNTFIALWSDTAKLAIGLECAFMLVLIGILLALSWWEKEPEQPEPPTVLTWFIFIIGVLVIIGLELLSIYTPGAILIWLWILLSIFSVIYFVLWIFQPWFEYWRHLYCRLVFTTERRCLKWAKDHIESCMIWAVIETISCKQSYVKEYQKCQQWETTQTQSCTSWYWFFRWICDAYTWVVSSVCKAWKWVKEVICLIWVIIRTLICVLWYVFVWFVCVVFFFILKLILVCWWK